MVDVVAEVEGELVSSRMDVPLTLVLTFEEWNAQVIARDKKCWRCGTEEVDKLMARQVGPFRSEGPYVMEMSEAICMECFAGPRMGAAPKSVRMNLEIDSGLHEQFKEKVRLRGRSISTVVRGLVTQYVMEG
jgi:hypothetical protein